MKLFTAMVSFNRLELLKSTINSYLETVSIPFELVIVDNGSDTETIDWLASTDLRVLLLGENRYPGFAANRGWELAGDADLLHRSDNDLRYLPGWSDALLERFRRGHGRGGEGNEVRRVGQVGLMTDAQEGRRMPAVGGNMAISRAVYDAGVRYTERGWDEIPWEDGMMTSAVVGAGFGWARVSTQCLVHMGDPPDFNDPYYRETYGIRGILPEGV